MLDVAFDTNVHAALCLARIGGAAVDEIALLTDDLTLGQIDDLSPAARNRARARYSNFPAPNFIEEFAVFTEQVRAAGRIRIWSSGRPYERAGALVACSLASADAHVVVANYERSGLLVEGVIAEDLFANAAAIERRLDREAGAARWDELACENAELRIVQNDEVVSVPEDALDDEVRSVAKTVPAGSNEELALLISHTCAERAGGLIGTDFFLSRLRALGLDRAGNR